MKPGSTQAIIAAFCAVHFAAVFGLTVAHYIPGEAFATQVAVVLVPVLGLMSGAGAYLKASKAKADAGLGEWTNE